MSDRVYRDVSDVRFTDSVTDIHADGDGRVHRFHQAPDRRFVMWEEDGWVWFQARRTIYMPRERVQHAEPMTPEKARQLGPNPYAPANPAQGQQQRNGK